MESSSNVWYRRPLCSGFCWFIHFPLLLAGSTDNDRPSTPTYASPAPSKSSSSPPPPMRLVLLRWLAPFGVRLHRCDALGDKDRPRREFRCSDGPWGMKRTAPPPPPPPLPPAGEGERPVEGGGGATLPVLALRPVVSSADSPNSLYSPPSPPSPPSSMPARCGDLALPSATSVPNRMRSS